MCDDGRRNTQNPRVVWHVEANIFMGIHKTRIWGEQENVVVVGSKKEKKTKE